MNLLAIAKRIEDLGLGASGTTLFVHEFPPQATDGILLRMPLTGIDIDQELPGYFRGSLQVIVRSPKYAKGDLLAKRLLDDLGVYDSELVPSEGASVFIRRMLPKHLPIVYRRSEGGGIEWSINYDLVYTMT